ncbi:helix-turn-helix domain-containing protein [Xenorhabdus sp. IM139775]|uniref:helix-turn-helix domain-containing protein n=1 Tax=Xenorhabdus sp. IM139775 TaxID=3025876 RepID=UPI002358DA45|nr:helix-turn-helix domain-containing protein [Xenorhabdus sp. IM139775]MDC9594487.1 helix-turn-helix domain-containing protein [Xenorhabdus sp. IM139775]
MKITSPQTLAVAIREQRKKIRLTQKDTADRVGMKQSTVSGFENNPEKSKLETLFKLLSALDLELQVTERNASKKSGNGWAREW